MIPSSRDDSRANIWSQGKKGRFKRGGPDSGAHWIANCRMRGRQVDVQPQIPAACATFRDAPRFPKQATGTAACARQRPEKTMKLMAGLASAALLVLAATGANAQDFPNRTVSWVVGFAPGGISDQGARRMAQTFGEKLGQTVIVENKPGAGG